MFYQIQAERSIKAPGTTSATTPVPWSSPRLSHCKQAFSVVRDRTAVAAKLSILQLLHLRDSADAFSSSKFKSAETSTLIRMDSIKKGNHKC